MIVAYQAVDSTGRRVAATLEAPDLRAAVESLRRKDLFVTHVEEEGASTSGSAARVAKRAKAASPHKKVDPDRVQLPLKQLATITRQLSMLLTSGSGLVPALHSIGRQVEKPASRQIVRQIILDLEEGSPLSQALRRFPRTFDSTYCAIVAAGEASATLPTMFERLSKIVGKRRAMRNKVLGALAYPALLTSMSLGIVNVLLFFVMPRFGEMFKTLGAPLPFSTRWLIAAGEFAKNQWIVCFLTAAVLLSTTVAGVLSTTGRQWIGRMAMKVPVLGRLLSGMIQGETFRVLGMLVEARVALLEAINLLRGVSMHPRYQTLYRSLEEEVASGGSISQTLEASGLIPPAICQAVRTGEESGQLGGSLSYVAEVLEEDNTELLNTVTKLLEPLILIVMGVVVGIVAVSLFLPMFDVTSAIR